MAETDSGQMDGSLVIASLLSDHLIELDTSLAEGRAADLGIDDLIAVKGYLDMLMQLADVNIQFQRDVKIISQSAGSVALTDEVVVDTDTVPSSALDASVPFVPPNPASDTAPVTLPTTLKTATRKRAASKATAPATSAQATQDKTATPPVNTNGENDGEGLEFSLGANFVLQSLRSASPEALLNMDDFWDSGFKSVELRTSEGAHKQAFYKSVKELIDAGLITRPKPGHYSLATIDSVPGDKPFLAQS